MSTIQPIDKSSIQKICCGQVIVDLATAVKELVENSLDACASSIEVKLKEMGIEGFEVTDNGCGILASDFPGLALKHHTSKLRDFIDLQNVNSFGFRGEAMNALCELSENLSIITRHKSSSLGSTLTFERNGRLCTRIFQRT